MELPTDGLKVAIYIPSVPHRIGIDLMPKSPAVGQQVKQRSVPPLRCRILRSSWDGLFPLRAQRSSVPGEYDIRPIVVPPIHPLLR